jgi:hypothetical protein
MLDRMPGRETSIKCKFGVSVSVTFIRHEPVYGHTEKGRTWTLYEAGGQNPDRNWAGILHKTGQKYPFLSTISGIT